MVVVAVAVAAAEARFLQHRSKSEGFAWELIGFGSHCAPTPLEFVGFEIIGVINSKPVGVEHHRGSKESSCNEYTAYI